jgi:hypothetical protein
MWNSGVVRRPNLRDVPQQEREARLKLARETTATIDATVAAVEVVEESVIVMMNQECQCQVS